MSLLISLVLRDGRKAIIYLNVLHGQCSLVISWPPLELVNRYRWYGFFSYCPPLVFLDNGSHTKYMYVTKIYSVQFVFSRRIRIVYNLTILFLFIFKVQRPLKNVIALFHNFRTRVPLLIYLLFRPGLPSLTPSLPPPTSSFFFFFLSLSYFFFFFLSPTSSFSYFFFFFLSFSYFLFFFFLSFFLLLLLILLVHVHLCQYMPLFLHTSILTSATIPRFWTETYMNTITDLTEERKKRKENGLR